MVSYSLHSSWKRYTRIDLPQIAKRWHLLLVGLGSSSMCSGCDDIQANCMSPKEVGSLRLLGKVVTLSEKYSWTILFPLWLGSLALHLHLYHPFQTIFFGQCSSEEQCNKYVYCLWDLGLIPWPAVHTWACELFTLWPMHSVEVSVKSDSGGSPLTNKYAMVMYLFAINFYGDWLSRFLQI